MMRKQWMIAIIAACAVAAMSYAASSAVYSRRMAGQSASTMERGMTPVIEYLQLATEQQERIAPINEKFGARQSEACTEMQEARARLLDTLRKPSPSQAEVDASLQDVSRAQSRVQRQVAEYLLEIKPVLTNEQKDKLFNVVGQKFCGQGRCGAGLCPAVGGPGRYGRCGRMR